jgi:hypothetical protein
MVRKTMWRKAAAAIVVLAGAAALYEVVWIPYRSNVVLGQADRALNRVWSNPESYRARIVAQQNVELLTPWIEQQPRNVHLLMAAATNLEVTGRFEAARKLYCDALLHDRRPELYMACGRMQLTTGDRAEALKSFVAAGDFAGLGVLREIPDGAVRLEALRIVAAKQERNLAAQGQLDTTDLAVGRPKAWTAAATGPKPDTLEIIPSRRRKGRWAIHVDAEEGGGIQQVLPRDRRRPRLRASAWVYVNRGTVCLGASNGRPPLTNVCSSKVRTWEKLEAVNDTCPATTLAVLAGSSDGADFIVDDIVARVAVGLPCER